jgi:hypothetical protein
MITPDTVGETLWTARVSPVQELEQLDTNAPLTGHAEARRRAAALREQLAAEKARSRVRVTSDTLRKLVR